MLIKVPSWEMKGEKHTQKTVSEFVNNIIMQAEDKDSKCYLISLKVQRSGMANLILYFQNGELKSHHSTRGKFDYRECLDDEIYDRYSSSTITVDNILSVDCDNEEDLKKILNRRRIRYADLRINRRYSGDAMESLIQEMEDDELRKSIKGNNVQLDKLVKIVDLLVYDIENCKFEINTANCIITDLEEENEILKQKIKWLGSEE